MNCFLRLYPVLAGRLCDGLPRQRDFRRVEVSNGIFPNATLVTWMFVSSQVIAPISV